jgi:spoIIIJ-associated protein
VGNQRFEGKNLEEALTEAAAVFGVERYQLTYHVVLEKRGFLGGTKRVVIEAEVNQNATGEPEPRVAPAPLPSRERPASRRPRGDGRGRGRGRERGARNEGRPSGRMRQSKYDDEPETRAATPEQGPQSELAIAVRDWCEKVIDLAGFDLDVRTMETDQEITVHLYGRDSRKLIDRNGELLDSFQVLANKALVGRKIEKSIEMNCAGFKERRLEDLGQRARELAERVRSDGREQMLPAMSPIERRIVHLALQDDAQVTTQSRGDGFYKRVAIIPRADANTQAPTDS